MSALAIFDGTVMIHYQPKRGGHADVDSFQPTLIAKRLGEPFCFTQMYEDLFPFYE